MNKITNDEEFINYGGINGIGDKAIDTESDEFKTIQSMIIAHSKKQSPEQRLKTEILAIKLEMINYLEEKEVTQIFTVGYFIKELLNLLKIKNKTFAEYVSLSKTNLSAIINGKRKINFDLAFKFESIFKIEHSLWLNIESKNESIELKKQHGYKYNKFCLSDLLEKEKAS